MQFQIFKRDTAVLQHLEDCAQAASVHAHLPSEVRQRLRSTAVAFRTHLDTLSLARDQHRQSARALRLAEDRLRKSLRHAFQAVRRHRQSLLNFNFDPQAFGLTAEGTLPSDLQYIREPVVVARHVLATQAELDTLGFQVLRDPNPAELTADIAEITRLRERNKSNREAEISAKATMDNIRDLANRMLRMVRYYLLTMVEVETDQDLKAILRRYGYHFKASTQEQDEPTQDAIDESLMNQKQEFLAEVPTPDNAQETRDFQPVPNLFTQPSLHQQSRKRSFRYYKNKSSSTLSRYSNHHNIQQTTLSFKPKNPFIHPKRVKKP